MGAIALGVAAVGTGIEAYEGYEAGKSRERALRIRMQQEEASANQRTINNLNALDKMMGRQNVVAAAQGSLGSQSFNAIQEDTINQFKKDANAQALSQSFQKQSELENIDAIQSQETASIAGAAIQFASFGMDVYPWGAGNSSSMATPRTTQPPVGIPQEFLPKELEF